MSEALNGTIMSHSLVLNLLPASPIPPDYLTDKYLHALFLTLVSLVDQALGDRARLAGRQLNLIRDTCEYIYRLEDDKERRKKKEQGIEDVNTDDSEQSD